MFFELTIALAVRTNGWLVLRGPLSFKRWFHFFDVSLFGKLTGVTPGIDRFKFLGEPVWIDEGAG